MAPSGASVKLMHQANEVVVVARAEQVGVEKIRFFHSSSAEPVGLPVFAVLEREAGSEELADRMKGTVVPCTAYLDLKTVDSRKRALGTYLSA